MPTLAIRPSADGFYSGYSSWFPANREKVWTTVDDLFANDDTDYLLIPPRIGGDAGQVSFPFGSASNLLPTQVVITCRAKIESGVAPELNIGFANKQTGATAVGAPAEVMAAGYATFTRTFTTNPFNGEAWKVGDMRAMDLYAETVLLILGTVRVTQLVAELTYTLPTNFGFDPEPHYAQTG